MIGGFFGPSLGNWLLNGNSNDISGNSNNGTDSNMSYVSGKFGSAGSFNGSSSRIALPNNASLRPTTAVTIMCWYKGTQNGYGTILQNFSPYNSKYWGFFFRRAGHGAGARIAKGTGTVGGTDYKEASFTTVIDDDIWHLIAFTFDGSNIKLYRDGKIETTVSFSATIGYTTTQYPMIGVRRDTSGAYTEYITGLIDGLVLLNRALTDADIRRWYAFSKGMLI